MSVLLLTGAASAAAHKIKSIIPSDNLLLGDFEPLPAMAGLVVLPSPESLTYIHDFLKICLSQSVSAIYPIRRSEIKALAAARQLFEEYGIEINIPEKPQLAEIPAYSQALCQNLECLDEGLYWRDKNEQVHLFLCD